ncbi:protocatechuate 3,4-dioxygenase subunit alpha [Alsobacter sp. R-9]
MTDGITPSQTVGPFFAYCLTPKDYGVREIFSTDMAGPDVPGERVQIEGRVVDGAGEGVADAMIEIWQADASGRHAHPADAGRGNSSFTGFGRSPTDAQGGFVFTTVKPGGFRDAKGALHAPHLNVTVFARGMLTHLRTRIYFPGDGANTTDPVLGLVPADRRATLVAEALGDGRFRFDIRLQGDGETVFFDA